MLKQTDLKQKLSAPLGILALIVQDLLAIEAKNKEYISEEFVKLTTVITKLLKTKLCQIMF